jgi:polysaccharide chain length determinant protein (PEP-CTERM system associated)
MSADFQLSPQDYLAIARRWAWASILTFGVVLTSAVVIAILSPHVYQSTGTLLVEAPQISGDVVGSAASGSAEQRIQALGRRIMTRESLLRVAADHNVYDPETRTVLKDTQVVDGMRSGIAVNVLPSNTSGWDRSNSNLAFNVSFQHGRPEKALEVTNALIQLFLESSTRERVELASRTNEFLTQEANRVKAQLEDLERRIAAYKRTQGSSTGEGQVVALASIQTLEADLRAAEREQRLALDELKTLEVELAGARSGVSLSGTASASGPSATEQELDRARSELAQIRGTYTEDHPDVRAKRSQIEMLERAVRTEVNASSPAREAAAAQARLAVSRLEAQVGAARARANLFEEQQRTLRSAISQQRSQVIRAPQVERDLAALQRDHDAARAQYEDLRAKQMSAQIVQNLEGEQQGERFTLLEPPLMPEFPIKPNRRKLVAIGFFLALAAAAGVAVVLETIFSRVRGVNAMAALTGARPMVVIPYITTKAELRSTQLLRKWFIGLAVGLGLIGLVVVHTLFVPLHTLLTSLISRLG